MIISKPAKKKKKKTKTGLFTRYTPFELRPNSDPSRNEHLNIKKKTHCLGNKTQFRSLHNVFKTRTMVLCADVITEKKNPPAVVLLDTPRVRLPLYL